MRAVFDGPALEGGIAPAIAEELELPVKAIGMGGSLERLRPLDAGDCALPGGGPG